MSVPVSFEVYPPRRPDLTPALHDTIQRLAEVRPQFITVTFGANGSSRDESLECLRYIRAHTDVEPLAHLTCVGSTRAEMTRLVREFVDSGVHMFLALRGDPPQDAVEGDFLGDIKSATDLVTFLREVGGDDLQIAVAAFPNGHPQSSSAEQDIEILLAKESAGAEFAITQLFFDAEDYLGFVATARKRGVTLPILPGIMPVTSLNRLRRIVEITGERMPVDLEARLKAAVTAEEAHHVGVEQATALCRALVEGGAPGLHLYAFNQHETVLEVLAGLDEK